MNKNLSRHFLASSRKAYTLVELSIAMGMMGLVGGCIYTVLNGGMILFSKNVATNYSNLAVRGASLRLIQDLHESIGRAELVNSSLVPTGTTAPSPAVRFPLLLNANATQVISDSAGNKNITTVSPTSFVSLNIPTQVNPPKAGDILIFPDIDDASNGGNVLTRTITAVSIGAQTTVTVKDLGVNIALSTDTPADPTIVYIVRLAAYGLVTVSGSSELRFYRDSSNVNSYTVVGNNLTTYAPTGFPVPAGPFSIDPANPSNVQVQLMSINAETGNRGFFGDRMLLNEKIPPKCLIVQSTDYH